MAGKRHIYIYFIFLNNINTNSDIIYKARVNGEFVELNLNVLKYAHQC